MLLVAVAACSAPAPFVYDREEFNRRRVDFGQDPKTISQVLVCYAKSSATPAEIVRLAEERCAIVGARAAFLRTEYAICPLVAPAGAIYSCVGQIRPVSSIQKGRVNP